MQHEILEEHVHASLRSDFLSLILFPTEQCNFRCAYCYEDFAIGTMRPAVSRGIKALISDRAAELTNLNVGWFGGEPLLAKRVILDISQHISRVVQLNPGLKYQASMTTNGFRLDLETLRILYDLGISSYQISLDGDQASHDKTRVRSGGGGTFDVIWRNIVDICNSTIEADILLRVHIHRDNIGGAVALCEKLKTLLAGDRRFSVLIKPIGRYGGPTDGNVNILVGADLTEAILRVRAALGDALAKPRAKDPVCYAAKANSLAIRADGRIAKCTVALNDERNNLGSISEEGNITLSDSMMSRWLKGTLSRNLAAMSCPLGSLGEFT